MDRRSSMNHVFASPPPPPPPPRPSTPPFDGEDEPYRDDLTPEDERVEVVVTPLTVVNKGDDSGDEGEVGGSRAGGDGDRPPVPDKI
ncbi:uncharacterized protein SPPG_09578 [Spizellomyces punctatus DAOM BR117]|uniref:Uncharacterized protein n=1 Tax=Spizellomyces punctatus (strain DAOM BR117) TaxID=645134 RepID=A0A0L0H3L5_SPIPD|nr:uncharacterized protein SPPG_09578 [Spizellomyces punctatus DAOM BR117]KNC95787.1 hypothetical protein SPPG_09578 [Spizellomyces punctatus DAOM BR117]|eukprot:XP_016603827.1 hypothetical protein SPPG_09578 [Spizellomyces punctatus DAOM BR117]